MYSCIPAATDQNALGIAGHRREHSSQADLMVLISQYLPDTEAPTFTVVPISRDVDGRNYPSLEANLNTQYTRAMAYPTPVTYCYCNSGGSVEVSPSREPDPCDWTGSTSGSTNTCSTNPASRRSAWSTSKGRISLWNMRPLRVTCSRCQVRV